MLSVIRFHESCEVFLPIIMHELCVYTYVYIEHHSKPNNPEQYQQSMVLFWYKNPDNLTRLFIVVQQGNVTTRWRGGECGIRQFESRCAIKRVHDIKLNFQDLLTLSHNDTMKSRAAHGTKMCIRKCLILHISLLTHKGYTTSRLIELYDIIINTLDTQVKQTWGLSFIEH